MVEKVALRILHIKCTRNIGEKDDGKFEALAPMNRHDPHNILALTQRSCDREICAPSFQRVDVAQEPKEPTFVCPLEIGGAIDEHAQICLTQDAARECSDIIVVSGFSVERPKQLRNAMDKRIAAPVPDSFQCVFSSFDKLFRKVISCRTGQHIIDTAMWRMNAEFRHFLHRKTDHRRCEQGRKRGVLPGIVENGKQG